MNPESIEEIHILTFIVMDIMFGIDMDQILEMHKPDFNSEQVDDAFWFHDIISFGNKIVTYKFPTLILIKDGKPNKIIIDQPSDIHVSVKIDSIQSMPPLIDASNKLSPIWGVAIKDKRIILLIDPYKCFAYKPIKKNERNETKI